MVYNLKNWKFRYILVLVFLLILARSSYAFIFNIQESSSGQTSYVPHDANNSRKIQNEGVDANELHSMINSILSSRAFRQEGRSSLDNEWGILTPIVEWLKNLSQGSEGENPTAFTIFRLFSLILGLGLLAFVVKSCLEVFQIHRRKKRSPAKSQSGNGWLELAEKAEMQGNLIEAIRCLYQESLNILFPAYAKTLPTSLLIQSFKFRKPERTTAFRYLTMIFNETFYGERSISIDKFAEFKRAFQLLSQEGNRE